MDQNAPNLDIFRQLLADPEKKHLIMQLLNENKPSTSGNSKETANCATLRKTAKIRYESPSALLRRRQLKQLEERDGSESDTNVSCGSSENQRDLIEGRSGLSKDIVPSPIPYERLLEGVVGYVEVKSKGGDRSESVKAFMRAMGARVVDLFTRDVTHVVFKVSC